MRTEQATRPNETTEKPSEEVDKAFQEAENPNAGVIPIYLEDVRKPPIPPVIALQTS